MALIITNNDNNYIDFNLQSNNNNTILTSFANSIRRILLNDINSLGFKYIQYQHNDRDIIIHENSNKIIHTDRLAKRLSLLTINIPSIKLLVLIYLITNNLFDEHININNINSYLKLSNIKQYLDKIIFKINIKNTSKDITYITTDLIDIFINDIPLINIDITKFTQLHFELFSYFNKSNLIPLLQNNDLQSFNTNFKNILFNHTIFTNIEIDNIFYNTKMYPKLITELGFNDIISLVMKLSIGNNKLDCTYDVVSTVSYSFEKNYDEININLIDMTKDIDDKLKQFNFPFERWGDISQFKISNKLIHERNSIKDVNLKQLIKEKDLLIQRYNIFNAYRIYRKNEHNIPTQYNLGFKYEGVHDNIRILYKAFKNLNKQILDFKNLFRKVDNIPYQDNHIKIIYSETLEDSIDIYITNSSHTIMNLINDYLYYLIISKEKHYYVSYKKIHQLSPEFLLRVICNNYKKDIYAVCDYILNLNNNILKEFKNN